MRHRWAMRFATCACLWILGCGKGGRGTECNATADCETGLTCVPQLHGSDGGCDVSMPGVCVKPCSTNADCAPESCGKRCDGNDNCVKSPF